MIQSEKINELLSALVEVQAKFSTLPKDKSGYGYKYTDIDTVISYVRPILHEHKIGFIQSLTMIENKPALTTRLFNSSGEFLEDTIALPEVAVGGKTNAAQNLGASITYMKRYALCSMLGISSDEDTDAVSTPQTKGGVATPEEKAEIVALTKTLDANGKPLFTRDEVKKYSEMRATLTARQVIDKIKDDITRKTNPLSGMKTAADLTPPEVQKVADAVGGEIVPPADIY